jgi:hypothetical protein
MGKKTEQYIYDIVEKECLTQSDNELGKKMGLKETSIAYMRKKLNIQKGNGFRSHKQLSKDMVYDKYENNEILNLIYDTGYTWNEEVVNELYEKIKHLDLRYLIPKRTYNKHEYEVYKDGILVFKSVKIIDVCRFLGNEYIKARITIMNNRKLQEIKYKDFIIVRIK